MKSDMATSVDLRQGPNKSAGQSSGISLFRDKLLKSTGDRPRNDSRPSGAMPFLKILFSLS